MSYPGPGPIYRHCIMCGRPFRVWRCELLRNRAKFCTVRCYFAARRLFSEALAESELEIILELKRRALQTRSTCVCRSPGWQGIADRALETAYERQVRELGVPLDS